MSSALYNPEIRVECLRLAYKVGQSPQETIAAAREYLAWVAGTPAPTTETPRPADGSKASSKRPAPA